MVDFKAKLQKKVDPRKVELEALQEDVRRTQLALMAHRQNHLEVFEELESLASDADEALKALKLFVRADFVGKKGFFTILDDENLSITAQTKWPTPTYDLKKLAAILGPVRTAALSVRVIDHSKLDMAVAQGEVDLEVIKPALVDGEQQTTAVTVKVK